MAEFGAGVYLTQNTDSDTSNFDFEVDESGDLRTIQGLKELEKDVSFFLSDALQDEIGQRRDRSTLKRIEIIAEDVLLDDPRIDSIVSIDASKADENFNRVEIVAEVNSDTGSQELVLMENL